MKEGGIIYSYVQQTLWDLLSSSKIISRKNLYSFFGIRLHLPKVLRPLIVKEMIDFNMFKKINKGYSYKVTKPILNPIDNLHILRAKLGLL